MVQSWNTEPITKSRNNNEIQAFNLSETTKPERTIGLADCHPSRNKNEAQAQNN